MLNQGVWFDESPFSRKVRRPIASASIETDRPGLIPSGKPYTFRLVLDPGTEQSRLNFKSERLNRGLSQRAMAAAVGVPLGVWKRVEAGSTPHPANARKIADYFELEVTDLWPLEEPVPA